MHLIKCELGHIYDGEKFRSCPHCYSAGMTQEDEDDAQGAFQADKATEQSSENEKLQYYVMRRRRVLGMLVCISGKMKGEAFNLKEGDNIIGRGANMDVALTMEESISRQSHAVIDCDADKGTFVLSFDESRDDVWLNGKTARSGSELSDRDVLRLGECDMVLIDVGDIWKSRG